MTLLQAIIIAIVEGITEFLPISSTGHMIITQNLLGVRDSEFVRAFTVNIQFGAILSVIVLYWKRFFRSISFYGKLAVACLPLVFAFLLEDLVDLMLGSVWVVAVSLLLGGIVLLFADRWFSSAEAKDEEPSMRSALLIGFFQIISIIPGISRSAATIIGGMSRKLTRKAAAEFSFFLAVPTMFAASVLKLSKNYESFGTEHIHLLVAGNLVAFLVAMAAIRFFIGFLTRHGFRLFGWYRIIVGVVLILLLMSGRSLTLL